MRKFLVILIPAITIALFLLIMLSDNFLKNPLTNNDNLPLSIESIRKDIEAENWSDAGVKVENLSSVWDKVVKRVQFSSEKDEIDSLYVNIARLKGAIAAKDKSSSLMELNEAYEHWENIGK